MRKMDKGILLFAFFAAALSAISVTLALPSPPSGVGAVIQEIIIYLVPIVLIVMIALAIKLWFSKDAQYSDSKQGACLDIKTIAAHIAKMNPNQLTAFKELLSKMPDEKPKRK